MICSESKTASNLATLLRNNTTKYIPLNKVQETIDAIEKQKVTDPKSRRYQLIQDLETGIQNAIDTPSAAFK